MKEDAMITKKDLEKRFKINANIDWNAYLQQFADVANMICIKQLKQ
jgi:hypothetical protein